MTANEQELAEQRWSLQEDATVMCPAVGDPFVPEPQRVIQQRYLLTAAFLVQVHEWHYTRHPRLESILVRARLVGFTDCVDDDSVAFALYRITLPEFEEVHTY